MKLTELDLYPGLRLIGPQDATTYNVVKYEEGILTLQQLDEGRELTSLPIEGRAPLLANAWLNGGWEVDQESRFCELVDQYYKE